MPLLISILLALSITVLKSTAAAAATSASLAGMVPNLELILLALLYGTFVAGVLIAMVLLALAGLALAFAAGLLSIVAVDSCSALRLLSSGLGTAKADVELGLVLLVCVVLRCGVSAASLAPKPKPKPWVERGVRASTEAARRARDHFS